MPIFSKHVISCSFPLCQTESLFELCAKNLVLGKWESDKITYFKISLAMQLLEHCIFSNTYKQRDTADLNIDHFADVGILLKLSEHTQKHSN